MAGREEDHPSQALRWVGAGDDAGEGAESDHHGDDDAGAATDRAAYAKRGAVVVEETCSQS